MAFPGPDATTPMMSVTVAQATKESPRHALHVNALKVRAGTPRAANSLRMRPRTASFSALPTGCGRSGPSTRASTASARAAEKDAGLPFAGTIVPCGRFAHELRNQTPSARRPGAHAGATAMIAPRLVRAPAMHKDRVTRTYRFI